LREDAGVERDPAAKVWVFPGRSDETERRIAVRGGVQSWAFIIRFEYLLRGVGKRWKSWIVGVLKVDDEVVERGGHADKVGKPCNNRRCAVQPEVDQLWKDDGDQCSRLFGWRRCAISQVQLLEVWMVLKNLRKLGLSVAAVVIVREVEFQRSEVGGCEDGGRGVQQEVLGVELRQLRERHGEETGKMFSGVEGLVVGAV
jgi:hypothetical protein